MYRRPSVEVPPALAHHRIQIAMTNLIHSQDSLVALSILVWVCYVAFNTKDWLDLEFITSLLKLYMATQIAMLSQS